MAKQKGILRFKGTMGGITFYKTLDGHLVRTKGGINAYRIANDPAFQRTRENSVEFGRAGKAGKLLRSAFHGLLINASDSRVTGRLTGNMLRAIKGDTVNRRGMRVASAGNLSLLKGFDFNKGAKLGTTVFVRFVPGIDRAGGNLSVSVEPFVPLDMINAPGTTHFRLTSGGAEIDFDNGLVTNDYSDSGMLPYTSGETVPITLDNVVTANSVLPLVLVFGVEFYQEVNGEMYPLRNGAFNTLGIVEIEAVP